MVIDLLSQLAASGFATALRESVWVYPLVNAAHILGISLLIGAIVPLDLRLMGVFRETTAIRPLARVLVPVSVFGLGLAAITGTALFTVSPLDYVRTDVFLIKIGAIGAGLINIAVVRLNPRWHEIVQADPSIMNKTEPDVRLRLAGAVSLMIWLTVLVCGRLVGYLI